MLLHIPTLLVTSVFVFSLMGLLSCHAWLRERSVLSLAYMAAMMLALSVLELWRGRKLLMFIFCQRYC